MNIGLFLDVLQRRMKVSGISFAAGQHMHAKPYILVKHSERLYWFYSRFTITHLFMLTYCITYFDVLDEEL